MKHKFTIIAAVAGLIIGSCGVSGCGSTAQKMNSVSVGMTKAEVIAQLGNPSSTRASQGVEYLIYKLRDHFQLDPLQALSDGEDYFVRLKGGCVETYGKVGDFDSARENRLERGIPHENREETR